MGEKAGPQKIVVCGAGPVGALAAFYAAKRGDDVHVYEMRDGKYIGSCIIELSFSSFLSLPFENNSPFLLLVENASISEAVRAQALRSTRKRI